MYTYNTYIYMYIHSFTRWGASEEGLAAAVCGSAPANYTKLRAGRDLRGAGRAQPHGTAGTGRMAATPAAASPEASRDPRNQ